MKDFVQNFVYGFQLIFPQFGVGSISNKSSRIKAVDDTEVMIVIQRTMYGILEVQPVGIFFENRDAVEITSAFDK